MHSWLRQAREVSGLGIEECALALCKTAESYRALEEHPGSITLDELRALKHLLNSQARAVVAEALREAALI